MEAQAEEEDGCARPCQVVGRDVGKLPSHIADVAQDGVALLAPTDQDCVRVQCQLLRLAQLCKRNRRPWMSDKMCRSRRHFRFSRRSYICVAINIPVQNTPWDPHWWWGAWPGLPGALRRSCLPRSTAWLQAELSGLDQGAFLPPKTQYNPVPGLFISQAAFDRFQGIFSR